MPTIILQPGREKSLLRKHPWIFSGAIKTLKGAPILGDTVDVVSASGQWLASAAFSPESQIRARVWSFVKTEIDLSFFVEKIAQAKAHKTQLIDDESNAYRLIAGESDGLPGLTVDIYGEVVVCQFLAAGVEKWKATIIEALNHCFTGFPIFERSDVDVRKKEGLPYTKGWLHGQAETQIWIKEHGLDILVDIVKGHKTGFYLDQRDNRAKSVCYVKGKELLNCFSYTGTFGLYALKHGAVKVINVDSSQYALDTAEQIYLRNGFDTGFENVNEDVFKLLRDYKEAGRIFDTIILDPPKFTDNQRQVVKACRGYKDINRLALQILKPGGTLLTFSCSGLIDSDLFQKVVADAAVDAQVDAQIIEKLTQAKDHSVSLNYPEGFYLKGLVVRKC